MTDTRRSHWEKVYLNKAPTEVSWYEPRPEQSLKSIAASGLPRSAAIIDVGGGASFLADELIAAGYSDVTVLDISQEALEKIRARFANATLQPALVQCDVTELKPERRYDLWHDRAVFHFLVAPEDRERYKAVLRSALTANGQIVIATFGPDGPERCSGLPVVRYSAGRLSSELGPAFRLMESSLHIHRTPWGSDQQFLNCRFARVA